MMSCFLVGVPAILSEFLYRYRVQAVKSKKFRAAHSSYIMGFRVNINILNLMYYPIFMFRRLAFAATIVILYDYPEIQLAFINLGTLGFAGYMIYWQPFKSKMNLYSAVSSELFFALFTTMLYIFTVPLSDYVNMILGWTLISTIMISITASWIFVAVQKVREWKRFARLKSEKSNAESLVKANEEIKQITSQNLKQFESNNQTEYGKNQNMNNQEMNMEETSKELTKNREIVQKNAKEGRVKHRIKKPRNSFGSQ